MHEKNTARLYLMAGDTYKPFSIVYALLGPATNSDLIRCQGLFCMRRWRTCPGFTTSTNECVISESFCSTGGCNHLVLLILDIVESTS